jgi:hypothetical protein
MKILSDKCEFLIQEWEPKFCISNFSFEEFKEKLEQISDELKILLENIKNDVKDSENISSSHRQIIKQEINTTNKDEISPQLISRLISNKIEDYFNNIDTKFRDIPISKIIISLTIKYNANGIVFSVSF